MKFERKGTGTCSACIKVFCLFTQIIILILDFYIALTLLLAQSTLHSITPARIASLGNLTYYCHARRRSQYILWLGTHIFPWVERGTVQVDILSKDVIPHETVGISGDRTHEPWIMSPIPYQLSHMRIHEVIRTHF